MKAALLRQPGTPQGALHQPGDGYTGTSCERVMPEREQLHRRDRFLSIEFPKIEDRMKGSSLEQIVVSSTCRNAAKKKRLYLVRAKNGK